MSTKESKSKDSKELKSNTKSKGNTSENEENKTSAIPSSKTGVNIDPE